jgi:hypothetical protein
MVADLCLAVTICRLFVLSRQKDDKTIIILFSPRKDDKTTRLGRKDDKHNPIISDLICRLFAWHFVVFSAFRLEKTTERQDDKMIIIVVLTKQKIDKTTKRQAINTTH